MRVTILQTQIIWNAPQENMRRAYRMMLDSPQSDLYVLPEMWSTGFVTEPDEINSSELYAEESLRWMRKTANKLNGAVSGTLVMKDSEGYYRNRHYFISPDGESQYYDKRHLFAYGGEDKHFEQGVERVVVNFRGVRILLATCYDLRFPVWLRNKNDYDILLIAANWPKSRIMVWNTLLKARAIENQTFVIGANRTGTDPRCEYSGGSTIIDAKANILACATEMEQSLTANIYIDSLKSFRKKFPVLEDRDEFCLKVK